MESRTPLEPFGPILLKKSPFFQGTKLLGGGFTLDELHRDGPKALERQGLNPPPDVLALPGRADDEKERACQLERFLLLSGASLSTGCQDAQQILWLERSRSASILRLPLQRSSGKLVEKPGEVHDFGHVAALELEGQARIENPDASQESPAGPLRWRLFLRLQR